MKEREELKLVQSFSELRAGMLVVIKPCLKCRKAHRGMLTTMEHCCYTRRDSMVNRTLEGLAWNVVPYRPCSTAEPIIAPHVVEERRLYRVVDGLDTDTTTTEQTPASRPREVVGR